MADYEVVMDKLDYLDETKQQIKAAIIEKGQTIEDDSTFRDYVEKIKEINSGDVRLFSSVEEMNNDPKPKKDGDLALVYNNLMTEVKNNIVFSSVIIPKTIIVGSTSTNSRYFSASGGYSSMSISIYGVNLEEENPNFSMNIALQSDIQWINMTYTSIDGLTYTFSSGNISVNNNYGTYTFDTETMLFEFNKGLHISNYDNVFTGLFMVKQVEILGLYEWELNLPKENSVYFGKNLSVNEANNKLDMTLVDWVDMELMANDIYSLMNTNSFYGIMTTDKIENHLLQTLKVYYDRYNLVQVDNKIYISDGTYYTDKAVVDAFISSNQYRTGVVDFVNWTFNTLWEDYSYVETIVGDETRYVVVKGEALSEETLVSAFFFEYGSVFHPNIEVFNVNTAKAYPTIFEQAYTDRYILAPNQLTLSSASNLMTNYEGLGVDRVYKGDGSYISNIPTREYYDYFLDYIPEDYIKTPTGVSQVRSGKYIRLYRMVERDMLPCTVDISSLPDSSSCIVTETEKIPLNSITNSTFTKAYNAEYNRTFYTKYNDVLYYGYFGYNMSDKTSNSESGGIVHEEFHQIYGVLINTVTQQVVKEVNYTKTWRPFNGWGNDHEDPNSNIIFLNYDFIHDEFVIFVDTGSWAWSGSEAPYLAVLRINGSTGNGISNAWKIGKYNAPRTYKEVDELRYDLTTQKVILPIASREHGGSNITVDIIKMDLNGNKTLWVSNGGGITQYSSLGGDESFYTFEPIYYYSLNNKYYLKRIDNDATLEIPRPYSLSISYRSIYNDSMYYIGNEQQSEGNYIIYKVNLSNMTYSEYARFPSRYATFINVNGVPHLNYNYRLYSLEDVQTIRYVYKPYYTMYNDLRIDGILEEDEKLVSEFPKLDVSASGLTFQKLEQNIYQYREAKEFPVRNDLCMTVATPSETSTVSQVTLMYNSILLAQTDYEGTINPFDYDKALRTAQRIEGK